jgi:hypothetical protein
MIDMKTMRLPNAELAVADAQAVLDHVVAGTSITPELAKRVRERAEAIRQQILATHGVQDIGVELIRELRGGLPES